MILRITFIAALTFAALPTFAADTDSAVIFGQIRLTGGNTMPMAYRLTARNIDTGKVERINLSKREPGSLIYDFAESLPAGKYYLLNMVAPNYDSEFRIGDAKSPFEVKEGATVYIGTWNLKLGIPTTTYTIDYDIDEISLFAKANPTRDRTKFMVGAPGKQAISLQTQ